MSVLYWQVECRAPQPVVFVMNAALHRWRSSIDHWQQALGLNPTPWPNWDSLLRLSESGRGFDTSGQIGTEHGITPWLWLPALKKAGFIGVDVGIVTNATRETSMDVHREVELLHQFGTDLEQIRPLAESLGLLLPKLDLVTAMGETDSYWF
jgi:hypothetical protein